MSNLNENRVYPAWIRGKKAGDAQRAEVLRFLIKYAAIHATPDGSIKGLCAALGRGKWGLFTHMRQEDPIKLDAQTAIDIEKLIGRDLITREELAPHIFKV
jgi:hypothetical protein